ncbi:hypothetical protein RHGRI_033749 [Rhododendron griersonianum]|uniref:Uncharacterized protein n=1 Tax=Rhododendron griersonianum TaxID=479676 RepID=A0AAV6I3I8_9ERIC|nr:hypothetical protein RHGRI_033749 [Rhododendron griersonianum]
MEINSSSESPGKGTILFLSLKLNPTLVKTPENPFNPFDLATRSSIDIWNLLSEDCRWMFNKPCGGFLVAVRYEPLVIALYQGPRFAIAGIQYRSTVISPYNKMRAEAKPQHHQSDPIRRPFGGSPTTSDFTKSVASKPKNKNANESQKKKKAKLLPGERRAEKSVTREESRVRRNLLITHRSSLLVFVVHKIAVELQDTRKKRYALWTWRLLLSQIDHRMFHEILRHALVHSLPTHIVLHTLRYDMNLHSQHLLLVFPSLTKPVVL